MTTKLKNDGGKLPCDDEVLSKLKLLIPSCTRRCSFLQMPFKTAPHTTVIGRLDQALAARKPNLRWVSAQDVTH
jgi:hypothetical protein